MCNACEYYINEHPEYNYCPRCGYNIKYSGSMPRQYIDNSIKKKHMSVEEYMKNRK